MEIRLYLGGGFNYVVFFYFLGGGYIGGSGGWILSS